MSYSSDEDVYFRVQTPLWKPSPSANLHPSCSKMEKYVEVRALLLCKWNTAQRYDKDLWFFHAEGRTLFFPMLSIRRVSGRAQYPNLWKFRSYSKIEYSAQLCEGFLLFHAHLSIRWVSEGTEHGRAVLIPNLRRRLCEMWSIAGTCIWKRREVGWVPEDWFGWVRYITNGIFILARTGVWPH